MKIKIDENLPIEVAEWLNQADHDAKTVYDQALSGHPDEELIKCCKEENRILITLDTDFADIRAYPPDHYAGIIVIRTKSQDKFEILKIVTNLFDLLTPELVHKSLLIVEEKRIRRRT